MVRFSFWNVIPFTLACVSINTSFVHANEVHDRWSSVYLGIQAGAAISNHVEFDEFAIVFPTRKAPWTNDPFVDWSDRFLGAQAGANLQWNNWVGGFELSIASGNMSGSEPAPRGAQFDPDETDDHFAAEIGPIYQVAARVGRVWNDTLFYGKFGLATAEIHVGFTDQEGGNIGNYGRDEGKWHRGMVAGVGIEHALSGRWSLAAEYQYINFQSERHHLDFFEANGNSFHPTYITAVTEPQIHAISIRANIKVLGY